MELPGITANGFYNLHLFNIIGLKLKFLKERSKMIFGMGKIFFSTIDNRMEMTIPIICCFEAGSQLL